MRILSLLLGVILVLSGCKSAEKNKRVYQPEPSWITSTPVSSGYYIGIFGVNKTNLDYRTAAKKGALDHLSSEISVNISGESVLKSLEVNGKFDQEFEQNVKITSTENLEGYELIDTWEGETEYWVYYRLSKSEFARIKREKEEAAIAQAKDFFSRGKIAHLAGDYKQAYVLNIQAIESLKGYLDDPLKTTIDGKEVYLGTEILSYTQQMMGEIELIAPFKKKTIKLGSELGSEDIVYKVIAKGKALEGIPLEANYKAVFQKKYRVNSDANGKAGVALGKINQSQKNQTLIAEFDFLSLAEEVTKDRLILALMEKMPNQESQSIIEVVPPKVYIQSKEKEFGQPVRSKLKGTVNQTLIEKGFLVTSDRRTADLVLVINADAEKGVNSVRGVVVFVKGSIEVFDKNKSLVFSEVIKQEKGLQLDANRASQDAYSKAETYVKRRVIPKLANQYFSF